MFARAAKKDPFCGALELGTLYCDVAVFLLESRTGSTTLTTTHRGHVRLRTGATET